jgi:hypothetical protein
LARVNPPVSAKRSASSFFGQLCFQQQSCRCVLTVVSLHASASSCRNTMTPSGIQKRLVFWIRRVLSDAPLSYVSCRLHMAHILSFRTSMHEHRQLPGVPHFSQPRLRCFWPGFGQGSLAPTCEPCMLTRAANYSLQPFTALYSA